MRSILVVGIGNDYRRDDGVGLVVVRLLKARNLSDTTVVETSEAGVALLEMWGGVATVILVDAMRSGVPAGTIHRFDAHARPLPTDLVTHSSHAFGLAQVIELARTLHCLPPSLIIYGIEGEDFGMGEGLSPKVARSVPELIERITQQTEQIPKNQRKFA